MTSNGIVLVASVTIFHEDKVLLIQENKAAVRNKWNFPGGRIEPGEDIQDAARREVKEETGYDVKLTGTTGIYNFVSDTSHQVFMFHFTGEIIGGTLQCNEDEISDSKWIALTELLIPNRYELRGTKVFGQIVENLLNRRVHSLALYHPKLEK